MQDAKQTLEAITQAAKRLESPEALRMIADLRESDHSVIEQSALKIAALVCLTITALDTTRLTDDEMKNIFLQVSRPHVEAMIVLGMLTREFLFLNQSMDQKDIPKSST